MDNIGKIFSTSVKLRNMNIIKKSFDNCFEYFNLTVKFWKLESNKAITKSYISV